MKCPYCEGVHDVCAEDVQVLSREAQAAQFQREYERFWEETEQ